MINAAWLLVGLIRAGAYQPGPGWGFFLLRVALACGLLAAVLQAVNARTDWLALQATPWARALGLAGAVTVAAVLYHSVLRVLGLKWWAFMRRAP